MNGRSGFRGGAGGGRGYRGGYKGGMGSVDDRSEYKFLLVYIT